MKCSKCGFEILNNTICPNCGNQIQGVVNTTPSLNVQPVATVVQPVQTVAPVQSTPVVQPVAPVQPAAPVAQPVQQPVAQPVQQPVAPVQSTPVVQPVAQVQPAVPVAQPIQQQVFQQQPMVQPVVQPIQQQPVQQPVIQPIQQQVPVQPIQSYQQPMTQMPVNQGFQSASISLDAPVVTNLQPIGVPKKKNKAPLITCLILLFVIIGLLSYIFNKNEDKEIVLKENGTRTIMIYMIGSNLESQNGMASSDIEEIIDSKFNEEDNNILIYTGGSNSWENPKINADENAIYEIKDGKLNKVEKYKQKLMTDYNTLEEFITYSYDNYKTDLYDLILWDHGGGPIFGYGEDETEEDSTSMSVEDINRAIKYSSLGKKTKLEILGFDACIMSSIEVAYKLKDTAKYMIASEETIPGYGWNYSFLTDLTKDTKTKDLSKNIVDGYFSYYEELIKYYSNHGQNYAPGLTLAVTDLSKVQNLVDNIDELFEGLDKDISISNYSKTARLFSRATVYGYQGQNDNSYDLTDLYYLVEQLKDSNPEAADKVLQSIESAVYYEKHNLDNSNGLSVYFPIKNKKYSEQFGKVYDTLDFSENYKSYVTKYINVGNSDKLVKSNTKALTPLLEESNSKISIDIDDDLKENYESGKYVVYRKLADNKYMLVNISSDVELEGNTLSAQASKQQLIVHTHNNAKPEKEGPGWVTMLEQSRNDEYAVYAISAVLERYDDEKGELDILGVYIMYRIYNGETKGEVIDVVEINQLGDPAAKGGILLSEWQDIKLMNYAFKLYNDNGEFLDGVEMYDDYYINTTDIVDGGIDLEFVSLDYDMDSRIVDLYGNEVNETTDEYYYQFIVTDTQGNNHKTQLVKAS